MKSFLCRAFPHLSAFRPNVFNLKILISTLIFLSPFPVVAQTVTNVFYASNFSGGDVGAQINAADSVAGSAPADIWVTVSGNVTTAPTISSNHRLILAAPLTWSVGPVLNSKTQIVGAGSYAVQTVDLESSSWINSSNISDIAINNVWFANVHAVNLITENTTVLHCSACSGVSMKDNHALRIGLVMTDSTATSYATVANSNISQNIALANNYVDGQGSNVVLAFLKYVQNVLAEGNATYNAEYNVAWWGGSAGGEGVTTSNPRWARNITVTGGIAQNVKAGFWGSMGQDVSVTGVTVDTCSDVGLDAESSSRVVFSGFTVHNCANGGLAVFYSSQHNEFGPGTVTSDAASYNLLWAHNASFNPTLAVDVKIHNVKFICGDPSTLCAMDADPIGAFRFDDNEVLNAALTFTGSNNSGYEISRNVFTYYYAPSSPFTAIMVPGQVLNYLPTSEISGNTFKSGPTQPAGTYAINATINDFNFSDILYVKGNITQGFTNDAAFTANSGNGGITPTFIFAENNWGSNSVAKITSGALGSFRTPFFGTPANSSSSCIQGQIQFDGNFIYTCVAKDTWRKVATSEF